MHPDLLGFLVSVACLVLLACGLALLWAWRVIRRLDRKIKQAEAELAEVERARAVLSSAFWQEGDDR